MDSGRFIREMTARAIRWRQEHPDIVVQVAHHLNGDTTHIDMLDAISTGKVVANDGAQQLFRAMWNWEHDHPTFNMAMFAFLMSDMKGMGEPEVVETGILNRKPGSGGKRH